MKKKNIYVNQSQELLTLPKSEIDFMQIGVSYCFGLKNNLKIKNICHL